MRREQFSLPALADAAFALAPGGVSDVIAAADGFHIVKVEEKITEDEVEKVKIAEIFVPLRPSYETTVLTRDRVLALADSAAVVGLPAAAGAYGVAPDSTGPFPREGFPRKLGRVQQAVDFAFSAKVGEIGPAMETADAWFILQLVSRTAERSPDLAEVRDRVRLARTQSIRRELALERAARLLESARTAGIAAAAAADSLAKYLEVGPVGRTGFVPGIGSEPKLLGAVFGSDTTAAPQIVASERGAFVFKVLEKIPASRDDFEREKANLRTRILQQRQNEVLTAWLEGLKEKADIEDFRTTLVSL
jgi:parvulin-like peptidyl-prolyl isomerase